MVENFTKIKQLKSVNAYYLFIMQQPCTRKRVQRRNEFKMRKGFEDLRRKSCTPRQRKLCRNGQKTVMQVCNIKLFVRGL